MHVHTVAMNNLAWFAVQNLHHKNIVKCHKVYKATTHWVFVLEYLKGGMLLNDLSKVGCSPSDNVPCAGPSEAATA